MKAITFSTPLPSLPDAFIAESRAQLAQAQERVVHCFNQLDDAQLHWRPNDAMNSLATLALHLCGNLRQWAICPITGAPDHRNRPGEFSDRTRYTRAELLGKLADTVAEADRALATVTTAEQLTRPMRVQGFDISLLIAICDSVSHFKGHSQEIVYVTRMLLGEGYRFLFVPISKEMGAAE